ncbi:MAG: DUF6516 family protein [Pseudomonadota bacterium]|nr:DUF6516 family protein [Pseudomonadota bacterium]
MKAVLIFEDHKPLSEREVVHMTVWRLPARVPGCAHDFKYRLAFVVDGHCVLRFDNERGKGDHKHAGTVQSPYQFTTPTRLLADFLHEVEICRTK